MPPIRAIERRAPGLPVRNRLLIFLIFAVASLMGSRAWAGPTFNYTSFDVPAGTNSPVGNSIANGISNNGIIVGTYYTDDTATHAYLLDHGVYTYLDAPNAGTGNFNGTVGVGINSSGEAVLLSADNSSHYSSYLYSGGTYTQISDPLAGTGVTSVNSINDNGIVTGIYANGGSVHPFQYDIATKTYSNLPEITGAFGTYAQATATNGDVLIYYLDSGTLASHAGILHNGVLTTSIDIPGAYEVIPEGINASGVVSGYYLDANFNYHGFEYINGMISSIDYPGAVGTSLGGINDAGQAVGYWYEASGEAHSLIVSTAVPEPSSLALCGLAGFIGMGIAYGRRRGA